MAANDDPLEALARAQREFENFSAARRGTLGQPWSEELVTSLSLAVLGFTVITLVLSAILLWRQGARPAQVLRLFGVLTIIGASTLLLVVGYSNEQLTPIVGLFGAIAGYLLGRETAPPSTGVGPAHRERDGAP